MVVVPFKELTGAFERHRSYFEQPEVQKKVQFACKETGRWLLNNTQRGVEYGAIRTDRGWWRPNPTNSAGLAATRRAKLYFLTYEHGMIRCFNLLEESGVLSMSDRLWDRLLSAETFAIWNELVSLHCSPEVSTWAHGDQLRALFGNGKRKMTTIRGHLRELTEMGLVTSSYVEGYKAKIGPVGSAFFDAAYLKAVDTMPLHIEECEYA